MGLRQGWGASEGGLREEDRRVEPWAIKPLSEARREVNTTEPPSSSMSVPGVRIPVRFEGTARLALMGWSVAQMLVPRCCRTQGRGRHLRPRHLHLAKQQEATWGVNADGRGLGRNPLLISRGAGPVVAVRRRFIGSGTRTGDFFIVLWCMAASLVDFADRV